MGHWKRLIKIPGSTDCYYCINIMTYLIHVYSCLVVLITVHENLPDIMLHVYLLLYLVHVTLSVVAYYACSALHIFCFLYSRHHYSICTTRIVVILHMPICMFTAITPPLACSFLLLYKLDMTIDMTR